MNHTAAILLSVAVVTAALVYLARELQKLAKVITFWSGLPKAHIELQRETHRNTEAIRNLTGNVAELALQVEHLARIERARGG